MALTPTRLEHLRRRAETLRICRENEPDVTPFLHVGSVLLGVAVVLLCADKGPGVGV